MRGVTRVAVVFAGVLLFHTALSQPPSRVRFNNQQLVLNGSNLAWISFANDIGPGQTDFATLGDIMLQMHDHGGNALRWWLHTNGTTTPQFNGSGVVTGPGVGTIADLKQALDMAWEREMGLKLCLWSFDMLRSSNNATVLNRNMLLLTDTSYTNAYIRNCLIPMVDSLQHHPAIIAWEIFNEPEGMSNEFGWSDIQHVPMSAIQRFVNLCAGAIHRRDSAALVTNGCWSFKALTDVPVASLAKAGSGTVSPGYAEQRQAAEQIKQKNRLTITTDDVMSHLHHVAGIQNFNYYTDARLIAAGGDSLGKLDFYSVHYYVGIDGSNPTSISPFHHTAVTWGGNKPMVVAEFELQNTLGIAKEALYDTLYHLGYAGALAWSWTDVNFSSHADILSSLQFMYDNHKADVDVNGIGGDWPLVTVTSPRNDSVFAAGAQVTIVARAYDKDGTITKVEFFANDTTKLGEKTTAPDSMYSYTWVGASPGNYRLTAVATDNQGHQRISNTVPIKLGTPPMTRLEAEAAARQGDVANIFIRTNTPSASKGAYVDMRTNDPNTTITWTFTNVNAAGNYPIAFGFRLEYDHPKTQYINVNGARVDTIVFDGPSTTTWYETGINVDLAQGQNTVQMQLSWGWMDVDYLAVPTNVLTSVDPASVSPVAFSLEQNYPNPFNPETAITYELSAASNVMLKVYDVLGHEIATLVNEVKRPGRYTVRFDGSHLASGVYFYRLQSGAYLQTRKLMLLK